MSNQLGVINNIKFNVLTLFCDCMEVVSAQTSYRENYTYYTALFNKIKKVKLGKTNVTILCAPI